MRDDEPASDPVDGHPELLAALRALLNRYLVLPDHATETVALWIVPYTFCFEAFDFTPYLAVMSPVKRCGKTTLLDIILELARRALNGDSITPAVVFRVVQKYKPALLLDKADQVFKTDDELRQLFNSGFRRNGRALRCEGDDFEPTAFSTFCPKAIGLIGELDGKAATTGDRSIYVRMRRKGKGERRGESPLCSDRCSGTAAPAMVRQVGARQPRGPRPGRPGDARSTRRPRQRHLAAVGGDRRPRGGRVASPGPGRRCRPWRRTGGRGPRCRVCW